MGANAKTIKTRGYEPILVVQQGVLLNTTDNKDRTAQLFEILNGATLLCLGHIPLRGPPSFYAICSPNYLNNIHNVTLACYV